MLIGFVVHIVSTSGAARKTNDRDMACIRKAMMTGFEGSTTATTLLPMSRSDRHDSTHFVFAAHGDLLLFHLDISVLFGYLACVGCYILHDPRSSLKRQWVSESL